MKKLIIAGLAALVSACAAAPEKTYPYGMTEKEWNELSIQDKVLSAAISILLKRQYELCKPGPQG